MLFFSGILLGLAIGAPYGPMGLMAFWLACHRAMPTAVAVALGCIVADGVLATLALFVVRHTYMEAWLPHRTWGWIATSIIAAVGLWLLAAPIMHKPRTHNPAQGLLHAGLGAFGLTLLNPGNFLAFMAVFVSGAFTHNVLSKFDALTLLSGILGGSALGWGALLWVIHRFHKHLPITLLAPLLQRGIGFFLCATAGAMCGNLLSGATPF
ncbi:MAG: hypothetical protein WAX89_02320 [Alphaproteobacteria bacterium]